MIDVNAHLDWVGFAEQYKFSHHLSLENDNLRFLNVDNFIYLCLVSTTPIMNPMSINTGLASRNTAFQITSSCPQVSQAELLLREPR